MSGAKRNAGLGFKDLEAFLTQLCWPSNCGGYYNSLLLYQLRLLKPSIFLVYLHLRLFYLEMFPLLGKYFFSSNLIA